MLQKNDTHLLYTNVPFHCDINAAVVSPLYAPTVANDPIACCYFDTYDVYGVVGWLIFCATEDATFVIFPKWGIDCYRQSAPWKNMVDHLFLLIWSCYAVPIRHSHMELSWPAHGCPLWGTVLVIDTTYIPHPLVGILGPPTFAAVATVSAV